MEAEFFYLQEAKSQAELAVYSYHEYEKYLKSRDTEKLFYYLHHFALHSTNIDKLLFPIPSKRNNFKFRLEILETIQQKVQFNSTEVRKLRNHLEHFDERLDKYVKNYNGQPFFDNNIFTGVKGLPLNKITYLRAIDGDNYLFYGEQFNIKQIYKSVSLILKALNAYLNE
ncbi:hypothetical protein C2869_08110 [Saccharobesus litoralis]|uniref:Uncharacterized protein n=1 Tax=Saccharobesus litoralis TaxID=2172099 RepID=A0A2S0VQ99_9ALTE|nr:hypothetical protein [Saccharobesus litoralis]AWB66393.1 hypothetical protein C2869_08110 [Saccharobesus litoralis]